MNYLILGGEKTLFIFVRTSSTQTVKNVNVPTWWIARAKKKKSTGNMKYSLQGNKANSFYLQSLSLMSLFCLFLSLSSLSSPAETNPASSLLFSHHWGAMLTNKRKKSTPITDVRWFAPAHRDTCAKPLHLKEEYLAEIENSLIIRSPSSRSKPVWLTFFCGTLKKLFWRLSWLLFFISWKWMSACQAKKKDTKNTRSHKEWILYRCW